MARWLFVVGLGLGAIACSAYDTTDEPSPLGATEPRRGAGESTEAGAPGAPETAPDAGACGGGASGASGGRGGACVRQVAAGEAFACALDDDGVVRCWGDGASGQTGAPDPSPSGTPRVVAGLGPVKQIAVGTRHACALEKSGAVRCWGDDTNGIVTGAPSTAARNTPAVVGGFPSAVLALVAVSDSQCAILDTGALWCWGNGEYGQLGLAGAPTTPPKTVPAPVKVLDGVATIGASDETLCAILRTGAVSCLGRNFSGDLGRGTSDTNPHPTPADVPGIGGLVTQISSGTGYHLALAREDGRVVAWGSNARRAIVDDANVYMVEQPRVVDGVTGAVEVAAGGYFTCARTRTGGVVCWGDASHGQTGVAPGANDGAATYETGPTPIAGLPPAQQITAGRSGFACALAGGRVRCWGANDKGQLGRGWTGKPSATPGLAAF
jgi:alpha-tubulin suppressor-like RCC1 family protein